LKKLFFALLCLIWGSTWLGIKIGLAFFPPFTFAAIRFLVATATMLVIVWLRHGSFSRRRADYAGTVWFGIFNGIDYALIFWGEQYISSGLTAIINATLPFFTVILACLLAGERFTPAKGAGLAAGFAGVVLAFSGDLAGAAGASRGGEAAVLAASAAYALGAVLAKRYENGLGLLEGVTVQMAVTTLVVAVPAVIWEGGRGIRVTPDGVLALLYLALVGSVLAFILYFWLLERMEVSRLSYISMITPVVAVLLGAWWGGERVLWQYGAGLAVIILGVWLVSRPGMFGRRQAGPGHRAGG